MTSLVAALVKLGVHSDVIAETSALIVHIESSHETTETGPPLAQRWLMRGSES
jgi:hypothetical protein